MSAYSKSSCGNWFRGLKEEFMISAPGYEAHPIINRTFLAPYMVGDEVWVKSNASFFSSFAPKKCKISMYLMRIKGWVDVDKNFHVQNDMFCFYKQEFDAERREYKKTSCWTDNFTSYRLGSYDSKTKSYKQTNVTNCCAPDELHNEITPDDYGYFVPENYTFGKADIEELIHDLGFSDIDEFMKLVPEKKPTKKKSVKKTISKKKTSTKSKVNSILEGLTDKEKAELLKQLTK